MTTSHLLASIPQEDRRHKQTEDPWGIKFGFGGPLVCVPVDLGDGAGYVGRLTIENLTEL